MGGRNRLGQVLVIRLERGGDDAFSMSIVSANHSISPDTRLGLTVPSWRGRTRPWPRCSTRCAISPRRERHGAVGIAYDLHDAFAVPKVDEDNATVITTPCTQPATVTVSSEVARSCGLNNQCVSRQSRRTRSMGDGRRGRGATAFATARQFRISDSVRSATGAV